MNGSNEQSRDVTDFELEASKYLLADMEVFLTNYSDQLIEYLKNQTEEFGYIVRGPSPLVCAKVLRNPELYKNEVIKGDGPNLRSFYSDSRINGFIKQYVPKTIKKLSLPLELVKDEEFISSFPNLESLSITGKMELTDLINFCSNTTVKEITIDNSFAPEDLIQNGISSSSSDLFDTIMGQQMIINGIVISYNSISDYPKFNLTNLDDLDKMIELAGDNFRSFKILLDGKVLASFSSGTLDVYFDGSMEFFNKILGIAEERDNIKSITVHCENKTYENIEEIEKIGEKYPINIQYDKSMTDITSIDSFETMRASLDYYKMLIELSDLSPVEKIMYAYEIVKSFEYNESDTRLMDSRQIPEIMETGNIVCAGYATLLAELLKELGIEACKISTKVPIGDELIGHARNLIRIDDDKYNIHGAYAFDPTWDSRGELFEVIKEDGKTSFVDEAGLKEEYEVIRKYDSMSCFKYIFIPASQYQDYFKGEDEVSFDKAEVFDPNTPYETDISVHEKGNDFSYDDAKEIPEDIILEIIRNVRSQSGYSPEINERLMEEVRDLREKRGPKSLMDDAAKKR